MEERHHVELIQEHQVKTTRALQWDKITCTIIKHVAFNWTFKKPCKKMVKIMLLKDKNHYWFAPRSQKYITKLEQI